MQLGQVVVQLEHKLGVLGRRVTEPASWYGRAEFDVALRRPRDHPEQPGGDRKLQQTPQQLHHDRIVELWASASSSMYRPASRRRTKRETAAMRRARHRLR